MINNLAKRERLVHIPTTAIKKKQKAKLVQEFTQYLLFTDLGFPQLHFNYKLPTSCALNERVALQTAA